MTILLLFISINLVILSLTAPAPFFRYLTPLIPLLTMITGFFLAWTLRIHLLVGAGILAVMVYLGPLNHFLYEITHDFNGPVEGIVRYLNEHARKDDTVAITYGDMPVKFYTGLRTVGGLTGEDLTPVLGADWVIIRNNIISSKDQNVREFLVRNLNRKHYKKIVLEYSDTPFENRESPVHHLYRTGTGYPPVIVYKKIR